ncbi:MAG: hypothetical protein H6613_12120 [Ignavibacteriales bacterium]|nr:hypothetical protein [Ignavibacteriales bacterium]
MIPHIEKHYHTNGQKTVRGKSLSGLFVMYAFYQNQNCLTITLEIVRVGLQIWIRISIN